MSRRCDICGKGTVTGNSVSHSNKRTKRIWKPNLHKVKRVINGKVIRLTVCSKCLKKIDQFISLQK